MWDSVCASVCMYVSVYESMSMCLCVSSECVSDVFVYVSVWYVYMCEYTVCGICIFGIYACVSICVCE